MTKAPILRSSRRDWIAAGIITAVCAAAVGGAYVTADIHDAKLITNSAQAEDEVLTLAEAPQALSETFSAENLSVPGQFAPVVSHGLVIINDGHQVSALTPEGNLAWSYSRKEDEVCSLGTAWDKVVITYRTGVGCGDVVSIDAKTGKYSSTRSAINSPQVWAIQSNDRVGTVSAKRAELWRSDMVRTVEYGDVQAKQEPNMQPHEECTIGSALTRKENFALTESCPDDPSVTWLRILKATPEDARKPEIKVNVKIPVPNARLVSIGENTAAVYLPGEDPQIQSFDDEGTKLSASSVAYAPAIEVPEEVFAPSTADLPHHMTWFDGNKLYLISPDDLSVTMFVPDALGTGVAVGDRLLVPTAQGLAVVNWLDSSVERTIPVDRQGYQGPVYLTMAGTNLVEARGDRVIALSPA